ncbi:hypothetical protein BpHYR1_021055 [Brachionus plicatilis]|uniref:Uncharacterized protein n=1 Tax=Brachionus plicatilis TaxID=10195 RepID=A0A3M7QQ94_BRAPC|nr:hypothetical protein BpHYR1_021055 [Brachionus plicatilis]
MSLWIPKNSSGLNARILCIFVRATSLKRMMKRPSKNLSLMIWSKSIEPFNTKRTIKLEEESPSLNFAFFLQTKSPLLKGHGKIVQLLVNTEKTVRGSIKVTTNFTNQLKDKCKTAKKSTPLYKQPTLSDCLKVEPQKWSKTSKAQKECEDLMVSTFALCLLPLSILDMGPFKDLIHKLNPQFNHVSRTVATRRLLPNLVKYPDKYLILKKRFKYLMHIPAINQINDTLSIFRN